MGKRYLDLKGDSEKWVWHSEQYAARRILLGTSIHETSCPCDPDGKWFDQNLVAEAEERLRLRLWLSGRFRFRAPAAPRDEADESLGETLYTEVETDPASPCCGQPTGRKVPLPSILATIATAAERKRRAIHGRPYERDRKALAKVRAELGVRAQEAAE